MISYVRVQLKCMIKDKTSGRNTSGDSLVSCRIENSVLESIDVPIQYKTLSHCVMAGARRWNITPFVSGKDVSTLMPVWTLTV